MTSCVCWFGPVYAPGGAKTPGGDIGKVSWEEPTTILTFNRGPDGGVGSSSFGLLASQYKGADGHILPGLLASKGFSVSDFTTIALAGFSAAHGAMNPILLADTDMVNAAVMLDACFEGTQAAPKSGYRKFGELAARGEKLMVMVGSSGQNGPGLPPTSKGYECMFNAANAAASDAGTALETVSAPTGIREPKCGVMRADNLWTFNFCDQFYPDQHGGIVHFLTEEILQTLLAPYLANPGSSKGALETFSKIPVWQILLGVAVAGGAVYGGIQLAKHRKRNPISGVPPRLYHVTLTEHLPAIRRQGLVPMKTSNWLKGSAGGERYGAGEIFAFEERLDALRWATKWDWAKNHAYGSGKIAIIEFENIFNDWEIDAADPLGQAESAGRWFKRTSAIGPEHIVSANIFTLEMVREAVLLQAQMSRMKESQVIEAPKTTGAGQKKSSSTSKSAGRRPG